MMIRRLLLVLMLLAGCAGIEPDDGAESMAPDAATNLALNRPATASSIEKAGLEPGKAVDGNTSTRWSSQFSDAQWIYVDLGATYQVTGVTLTWETAYASAYQIQVSADASSWTTIFSTRAGAGGVENRSGLSGTGRYVRINCTKRATQWGYSLWELAVHGTPVTSSGGAFALRQPGVAAQSFSGSSLSCTFASAPSAGDLVVVGAGWFDAGTAATTVAVADDSGHAFQIDSHTSGATNVGTAGQAFQAYLLAAPDNVSNTITATFGDAFTYAGMWCDDFAVSGGTAQYDAGAVASGTGAISSPTIPVSGAGRLLYAVAMDADSVGAVQAPWTGNAGGAQSGNDAAYVLSASASTAVALGGTTGDAYNAIGMSFTLASSSGTTPTATLAASPSAITAGQSATLSWSSTNAASCTGTGFTASGTSGSATVKPAVTTTYSVNCGGASASATVTVSSSSGFALGQAPFAASSTWNTPIASGATYTKLGWPAYTGYNYGVAWDSYAPSVFIAGPNDPVVSVSYPAGWGYPGGTLQIRMPAAANGAAGTDGELVVISDNVVHNFWQFDRTSTTTATASSYGAANVLTGTGWGTSSPFLGAGTTAAGASEFAGLLVEAETDAGEINHALQIAADGTLVRSGFTGQAIAGDGGASNGLFQEGARLAIPPGTAMPSGLSPLGQKVFRAYVKYGAFVIDVAGGTTNLRAQANAYDAATITALLADLGKLTPMLQAVH